MYFKNIKMKNNELFCNRTRGFTLVEVIVTLVVAAILGTILATYYVTVIKSANPLLSLNKTYNLGTVMENITADYKQLIAQDSTPLATLKSRIGAAGSAFTNSYGSYMVIYNKYIIFSCTGNTCSESDGASNFLEVKIADTENKQTITTLFTQ